MTTMIDEDLVSNIRQALDERAEQAGAQLPYWVFGGPLQCRVCAEKEIAANPTLELEGGYYIEAEGWQFCDCGALLDCTQTAAGAAYLLQCYQEAGWDWDNPTDCLHIAAMLGAWIGDGWFDVADIPEAGRTLLLQGQHAPPLSNDA